jgi:hypothetical protein
MCGATKDSYRGDIEAAERHYRELVRHNETPKQSCWNCQFGLTSGGSMGSYWDPPEPAMVECRYCEEREGIEDEFDVDFDPEACVLIDQFWDEELTDYPDEHLAGIWCPAYMPITVDRCAHCGERIGTPEAEHKLWAIVQENLPTCSTACKEAMEEGYEKHLAEMTEEWPGV